MNFGKLLNIYLKVWFQNKRARYRKKMHKENDDKVETKKSLTRKVKVLSPIPKEQCENLTNAHQSSPIRHTEQHNTQMISTPVSSYTFRNPLATQHYKFNESKTSAQDSGYLSVNHAGYSPFIDQSHVSRLSDISSTYSFNSIGSLDSPQSFYYYPPFAAVSAPSFYNEELYKTHNIPQSKPRVPKSVFRPYE